MLYGLQSTRCLARSTVQAPTSWRLQFRGLLTLAIETSCDDTCVAVLEKSSDADKRTEALSPSQKLPGATTKLHFNKKITLPNTGLGGIHPLEALDNHHANLGKLVTESLAALPAIAPRFTSLDHLSQLKCIATSDGTLRRKPDFVTVTRGPGMRANLSCGLEMAKGLSIAWQVPLVGVHHMQAHALTPRLVNAMESWKQGRHPRPDFPFLTLLVSGGHTMLVYSKSLIDHRVLATTADVAIGDTLDKCGRLLLPEDTRSSITDTAFGKHLSRFAFPTSADFHSYPVPKTRAAEIQKPINQYGWQIPIALSDTRRLAFSFTGIASATFRIFEERMQACNNQISSGERLKLAQFVLGSAFETLGSRTILALKALREEGVNVDTLVVSGGVAANDFLRYFLRKMLDVRGFHNIELIFPPVSLCTDNAAMIAWCGMEMFESGYQSELSVRSIRKWDMDPASEDGGIVGVGGWTELVS